MTQSCSTCALWKLGRRTIYDDGSVAESEKPPEGKGRCTVIDADTPAAFGCNSHVPAEGGPNDHFVIETKDGAPWQHWRMISCPDCAGNGSFNDRPDDRCVGTGKVRLYDDGYIGDERTRTHPREREVAKPTCGSCGAGMERAWKACPVCGRAVETPATVEVVSGLSGGTL